MMTRPHPIISIVSLSASNAQRKIDYGYDAVYPLTSEVVRVSTGSTLINRWSYDAAGNIGTQTVNFTAQPSQTTLFGYDANGNLTNSSSATGSPVFWYQYDAENRLVNVTSNGVVVLECWYDGAGHRVAKREIIGGQTNTWQYIWDGWNLIAVLGGDGKLKEFYTRGVGVAGDIGTLVAVRHWTNALTGPLYYLHNNHRGDVILARQGTVTVATLDYAPYGETRTQSGSYTPRFRFSSKEYDAATGFYHFPYRYYAPMWARWVKKDSLEELIGAAISHNLYCYVDNSPASSWDVLGLCKDCDQICEEARASGAGSIMAPGTIICGEGGKKCACYLPGANDPAPGECPLLEKAVIDHETGHFGEFTCDGREPGLLPKPLPGYDFVKSECKARRISIKNLKDAHKKATGECKDRIKFYLDSDIDWVGKNCW